ncbi:MAG TPA: MFS transporter [Verrucomicrobiae bacterium]|nr:MFS transporter [Verrucomicrobiae bacterium]
MNQKAKDILRPLYAWAFTEALIFWYAIEKLLWSGSGITAKQIIILGIIAQSSQILIEVPSSIIADRWSRRKSLMVSSVFMLTAIVIVLSVRSFLSFAIMSLVWAFYYSFQSGTVNAYIYDLLKEKGEQSQYRKALSRYTTFQLAGLLVSSLAASVLIKLGDLLTPYWVTLIPTVVALVLLWRMHDPAVERTEQSTGTASHHVRSAILNVSKKKWLIAIFVALALVTAGRFVWYEYYQLYALKQNVAPMLFGLLLALIHVGNIAGSEFAHRVKSPNRVLLTALGALLASTTALAFVTGTLAIVIFLVVCFFGSQAGSIVLDENLQHETASELRATTLSMAGLVSRIFFGVSAGVIIAFNTSPRIIAIVTLVAFIGIALYLPVRKRLASAVSIEDELIPLPTSPEL